MTTTQVQVPGTFYAEYDETTGEIDRLVFQPSASAAGYFGPAAEVTDGNEDLDVESTDGPFWQAVQRALAPTSFVKVQSLVDQEDIDHEDRSTVEIEWTE